MTEIEVAIESIWPERAPIVGMVHLMPLPGSPRWGGSMGAVFSRATTDAEALTKAGFDGILVENYADVPFLKGPVPAETVAAMTAAVLAVRDATGLPVGVNVLRNDAHAAVAIATATGARFIRVNVHAGSMWTDQGLVEGARRRHAAVTLEARWPRRDTRRRSRETRDPSVGVGYRNRRVRQLAEGTRRRPRRVGLRHRRPDGIPRPGSRPGCGPGSVHTRRLRRHPAECLERARPRGRSDRR